MLSIKGIVHSVYMLPPLWMALGGRAGRSRLVSRAVFPVPERPHLDPSTQCKRAACEGGVAGSCFVKVTHPLQQEAWSVPCVTPPAGVRRCPRFGACCQTGYGSKCRHHAVRTQWPYSLRQEAP